MAEEVGIVMSLYDRVSPTLKAISGNSKAFDKTLDELEQSLKAYEKAQNSLVGKSADLKKALSEADQKVKDAQKSYKKLKDETSKGALDDAIDEQTRLKNQLSETEGAIKANETAYRALYKAATDSATAMSKAENRAGSAGGGKGIMSALGQAGAWSMLGDVASQWANTLVGSAFGSDVGTLFSGALAGAGSGAAIGSMIAPGIGTAIGAALGGLVGLVGGGAQIYERQDDAFKAYYQQLYEQGQQQAQESLTSGSATASQRELDEIAFNRLLGQGADSKYLEDLRVMAAATPMEYSDLTGMSRALATGFGDSPERMLDLMAAIGDAGSAVGVTAQDMTMMAQAMSRMQGSGKASLEYLNILQERGVNVIGMLADAYGKSQGEIYDMISKGKIKGQDAVDIIQSGMESMYGGAMEVMAQTFGGLTSTLEDAMTEIDAARGRGYNSMRAGGLQQEIDAYGGVLGEAVSNLNTIAGQNQAYLENLSEQYSREALSAVLLGQETTPGLFDDKTVAELKEMRGDFIKASADYENGSQEAGLKMDNLRMEAEALATAAYESSSAYQLVHDSELDLIGAIRENTTALNGWRNNYDKQQEYSKGRGSVLVSGSDDESPGARVRNNNSYRYRGIGPSLAVGIRRVPYNGFPAMLHEDERVLTAQEARRHDAGAGRSVSITISGNTFADGASADGIAQQLADLIELKLEAGVLS